MGFHELLNEGNLVKPKYDFYDFYLNGKYLGYYNVERVLEKFYWKIKKKWSYLSIFEYISYFQMKINMKSIIKNIGKILKIFQ